MRDFLRILLSIFGVENSTQWRRTQATALDLCTPTIDSTRSAPVPIQYWEFRLCTCYTLSYSLMPERWDLKIEWSSASKTASMLWLQVMMSWWPFRIPTCIPMTIACHVFSATGCTIQRIMQRANYNLQTGLNNYIHKCIHTCIHVYVYTYVYIYIYTHRCSIMQSAIAHEWFCDFGSLSHSVEVCCSV